MNEETLQKLKAAGLESYFDKSYGWAYFENVGKGAFIVGVGGGSGVVYTRKEGGGMTEVGKSTMVQSSAGWSLGVQVTSEIIFFEDEASFTRFTKGSFELEASAKCAVVTLGADSSARTTGTSESTGIHQGNTTASAGDGGYTNGMMTFVILKAGLMVDVSVGGQKFIFNPN